MEQNSYGSSGNGYGAYSGYSDKPVTVLWSKARIQIRRYFSVLGRYGWVLPLTISFGVLLAAWVVSQMPPDYISHARMLVTGSFALKEEGATYNEQAENFYGTQTQLMQSLAVLNGAMQRVQTLHPELLSEPGDQVRLLVAQERGASVFNLSFEAQSAPYAQAYLEAVMLEYTTLKQHLRTEKSETTSDSIQKELVRVQGDMDTAEKQMDEFRKANKIGLVEQQGNDAAVFLAKTKVELANLKTESNLLQMLDLDQNLDRQRNNGATQASADGGAPKDDGGGIDTGPLADYQKVKQQLELLKVQRAGLAERLRPAHPDMMAIDQKIDKENELLKSLRSESIETLKSRRDSIQIQIQNLEGVIKEWEATALDVSGRINEYNSIKTRYDRSKEEYERLLSNQTGVAVTKNVDQDSIMIMDHASPGVSIKPGWTKIILAGFAGGLLAGLAILFCIDQLDDRIGSFIELQSHFQETILGQIPRVVFSEETALLRQNDDRLALLEGFRSLRSSLIFFPAENTRPKTLVITSALPNEGKTTLSANLAITMAFSGARTLLVDADMRRGRLSHLFGVTEGNGLSTILLGTLPWQEVVHQTTVENLSLISCGASLKHPAEHLLGKVADQFLKAIYDQYDYIIFDSPPVTLLDDTLSLAPKVDGAMVVVRFGVSSVRTTRRTLDLLRQRQTNVLGLICNDVQLSESEHNYGYYYRQTVENYHKEISATG